MSNVRLQNVAKLFYFTRPAILFVFASKECRKLFTLFFLGTFRLKKAKPLEHPKMYPRLELGKNKLYFFLFVENEKYSPK